MLVEEAYEIIARYAIACVGSEDWESVVIQSDIYDQMTSSKASKKIKDNTYPLKQSHVSIELGDQRNDATLFLRDNILETTGERVWSMIFSLTKEGKMKINYGYEKPKNYEG